jgi:hypothetical protein
MTNYGFWDWLVGDNGIVAMIPTVSLPDDAMTVFGQASDYIAVIAHYVPVDTLLDDIPKVLATFIVCAIVSAVLQLA